MHSVRRAVARPLVGLACALACATAATATSPTAAHASGRGQRTDTIATADLVAELPSPVAFASRPGDTDVYIAGQRGVVIGLSADGQQRRTVLDLTSLTQSSGERGLLGLTFSPDANLLYVHYAAAGTGTIVVAEYEMTDGVADPTTRRVLLTLPHPALNHNGGQLAFGPDGMLYVAIGDGGGRDDDGPGHVPGGNGQSLDTLLGKILRIDPTPSGNAEYRIPDDNPYADGGGRPEIYVSGLRNPWRFSFDRKNGDLWIADVGQDHVEEVTRLRAEDIAGANLGWNRFEGTRRYRDGSEDGLVMPQIETNHDDGNSAIVGGYVYRGSAIPGLRGWYLYSDYCNGTVRAAKVNAAGRVRERDLGISLSAVSSFGEDSDGELYVLSHDGGAFRIGPA